MMAAETKILKLPSYTPGDFLRPRPSGLAEWLAETSALVSQMGVRPQLRHIDDEVFAQLYRAGFTPAGAVEHELLAIE